MAAENFGPEETNDGRWRVEEPAVDQAFEVDNAHFFALEVHRANREPRDGRHLDPALF